MESICTLLNGRRVSESHRGETFDRVSSQTSEAIDRNSIESKPKGSERRSYLGMFGRYAFLFGIVAVSLWAQQSPWGMVAKKMGDEFTGPIVRGFSLVAIVIGGLTLAFSDGGGKRTIGGLIFGLGMALGAAQFMTWLFA